MREKDYLDVSLKLFDGGIPDLSLPDVVAAGRLFILGNDGNYIPVVVASYWRRDQLYSVCCSGYEYNEDGEITRDWRDQNASDR